jgi:hypothetical protein
MDAILDQDEIPLFAQDCAPRVGTSKSALLRMGREGIVPCIRTGVKGKGVRFVPRDVRQALQDRPAWSPSERL